jgi:excisionase family DNA binding protein
VVDTPISLLTSSEVADVLRLNHQVVQRKLQSGEIPGYRIGREWRVEQAELMRWLEQRSNQRRNPADRWFDPTGRLRALPARRSLRRPVLERLAAAFEPDRTYPEREVNAVLRRFHDDVASLRREMVAERLFVRSRSGVYKLAVPPSPALRRA